MMNKLTRRLSKIPEEVRGEIEPYFLNYDPVIKEDGRKLKKLDDDTADFIRSGLTVSSIGFVHPCYPFFLKMLSSRFCCFCILTNSSHLSA